MYSVGLYNPKITSFPCYKKPYADQIDLVVEKIKDLLSKDTTFILDINHADGDAAGSILQIALLLDEVGKKRYYLNVFNGLHHLTFSSSIFPESLVREEVSKGRHVVFITTDNTPWVLFFKQVRSAYRKFSDEEKKRFELLILDHHPWMERDKVEWLGLFLEDDMKETPQTTYINAGWEKDVLETWWKVPSIRCAGEITFDVSRQLIQELYPEKENKFIQQAVIPLLVATGTDMQTEEAIERYAEIDRKIYEAIKDVSKYRLLDKYRGEVTPMDRFINIANGAIRISGALIDRPYYEIMNERMISNYPTHRAMYDVARALYFAAKYRNPMALVTDPTQIGLANHSPIVNVLNLDKEHEKIKSSLRASFLKWDVSNYVPREDACIKFDDTNVLICMIYGKNRIITKGRYKEKTKIDIANLLKVAPYMQYFLTNYPPIASLAPIASSSFIVTVVEGCPYEPKSYAHLSLRSPPHKRYSWPLGLIAESISACLKKILKLNPEDVQGGGHENAAAVRIRQHVLDRVRKDYCLDKFETINWIIKESVSRTLP